MARVDLRYEGQIRVLSHAVDQTQARDARVEGMVRREVRQSIVARVADAIRKGRAHDSKPRGFGLSFDKPPDLVVVTCLTQLPRVL